HVWIRCRMWLQGVPPPLRGRIGGDLRRARLLETAGRLLDARPGKTREPGGTRRRLRNPPRGEPDAGALLDHHEGVDRGVPLRGQDGSPGEAVVRSRQPQPGRGVPMDPVPLVEYKIDAGWRLLNRLEEQGVVARAACWVRPFDRDRWSLYIATPS